MYQIKMIKQQPCRYKEICELYEDNVTCNSERGSENYCGKKKELDSPDRYNKLISMGCIR